MSTSTVHESGDKLRGVNLGGWHLDDANAVSASGEFIHAMPYHMGADEERTPLMREIRREGIDL